jgi:hypothetical protein
MARRRIKTVALAAAMATALLFGVGGGTAHAGGGFVPDDSYAKMKFHRAWHDGAVDWFSYQCDPLHVCKPLDANITVHDRPTDGATCTDLQARLNGQDWGTVGTVCNGDTTQIQLRNVGDGAKTISFRLRISGLGSSKPVQCVRRGDGNEACR